MDESKTDDEQGEEPKLPYEPPAVISEEVFETLALACTKLGGRCGTTINS